MANTALRSERTARKLGVETHNFFTVPAYTYYCFPIRWIVFGRRLNVSKAAGRFRWRCRGVEPDLAGSVQKTKKGQSIFPNIPSENSGTVFLDSTLFYLISPSPLLPKVILFCHTCSCWQLFSFSEFDRRKNNRRFESFRYGRSFFFVSRRHLPGRRVVRANSGERYFPDRKHRGSGKKRRCSTLVALQSIGPAPSQSFLTLFTRT